MLSNKNIYLIRKRYIRFQKARFYSTSIFTKQLFQVNKQEEINRGDRKYSLQMRSMTEKTQQIPDLSNIYAVPFISHSTCTQILNLRGAVFPFIPLLTRKKNASLQNCDLEAVIPCFLRAVFPILFLYHFSRPEEGTAGCSEHCKSTLLPPAPPKCLTH